MKIKGLTVTLEDDDGNELKMKFVGTFDPLRSIGSLNVIYPDPPRSVYDIREVAAREDVSPQHAEISINARIYPGRDGAIYTLRKKNS